MNDIINDIVLSFVKSSTTPADYTTLCAVNKSFRDAFVDKRVINNIVIWLESNETYRLLYREKTYALSDIQQIDNSITFEIDTGFRDIKNIIDVTISSSGGSCSMRVSYGKSVETEEEHDDDGWFDEKFTQYSYTHIRTLAQLKKIFMSSYYHPEIHLNRYTAYTTSHFTAPFMTDEYFSKILRCNE
jgi:hypothetical protein